MSEKERDGEEGVRRYLYERGEEWKRVSGSGMVYEVGYTDSR